MSSGTATMLLTHARASPSRAGRGRGTRRRASWGRTTTPGEESRRRVHFRGRCRARREQPPQATGMCPQSLGTTGSPRRGSETPVTNTQSIGSSSRPSERATSQTARANQPQATTLRPSARATRRRPSGSARVSTTSRAIRRIRPRARRSRRRDPAYSRAPSKRTTRTAMSTTAPRAMRRTHEADATNGRDTARNAKSVSTSAPRSRPTVASARPEDIGSATASQRARNSSPIRPGSTLLHATAPTTISISASSPVRLGSAITRHRAAWNAYSPAKEAMASNISAGSASSAASQTSSTLASRKASHRNTRLAGIPTTSPIVAARRTAPEGGTWPPPLPSRVTTPCSFTHGR